MKMKSEDVFAGLIAIVFGAAWAIVLLVLSE
jgi:hypothetical protein